MASTHRFFNRANVAFGMDSSVKNQQGVEKWRTSVNLRHWGSWVEQFPRKTSFGLTFPATPSAPLTFTGCMAGAPVFA